MREPVDDTRCPCDHGLDGMYRCLNGLIYGPCDAEDCYGICADAYGHCKSLEGCCDDELV